MKLIVRRKNKILFECALNKKNNCIVGRSKHCQVVLQDPYVSREHAKVKYSKTKWLLTDLDSDNGTRLKRKKIHSVEIFIGDRFKISDFTIELSDQNLDPEQINKLDFQKSKNHQKASDKKSNIKNSDAFMHEIAVEKTSVQQDVLIANENTSSQLETQVLKQSKKKPLLEASPKKNNKKNRKKNKKSKKNTPKIHSKSEKKLADATLANSIPSLLDSNSNEKTQIHDIESSNSVSNEHSKNIKETIKPYTAKIICLDQDKAGFEYLLTEKSISIGQDEQADIKIKKTLSTEDDKMQKTSATLNMDTQENAFLIDKLDATDTEQSQKTILKNHDIFEIAGSRFEFIENDSPPKGLLEKITIIDGPIQNKRKKRLMVLLSTFIVSSVISYFIYAYRNTQYSKTLFIQSQTNKQEKNIQQDKLFIFHLSQASDLLQEKKFSEAGARIRLILNEDPQNSDALKLLKKINTAQELEEQDKRQKRLEIARRHTKIRELLSKGDQLLDQKKYKEALQIYKQAKDLDPKNSESLAALEHLERVQEEDKRIGLARKNELSQLRKLFNEGLEAFEKKNYPAARKFLKQVIKSSDHKFYKPAKNILDEIQTINNQYILSQVNEVRELIALGKREMAYVLAADLKKRYPYSKTIAKEYDKLNTEINQIAAEAYREGMTLLEIANDPSAAIDQFEKVLSLTNNNPNNPYYQKAKTQLDSLLLSNQ